MASKNLAWKNISEKSLSDGTRKLLEAKRAADQAAKEARLAFEKAAIDDARAKGALPEGKTIRFGYRWGTLTGAIDDAPKAKSTSTSTDEVLF